ncbi:type VI secretion system tip protein VgrG [Salmonella enterica subsp. enterica serovar Richmond]|uniref:Type VI secretion system tip protein VgrG n=13 Tax=Salmonella enterica TaxID=28901 RepID=A0A759MQN3_SALER|nr:type VI secretion system tip protein VgrG [Salmonella enterica subsp. enterica serovar Richmond]EDG9410115.1 type VI secretion system tip protein VgrG [Salmonella enterica subsp. enterica serovar Tennessee]EJJ7787903.1 type VI secretion system tip protein VgrG [Salmonella enterica]EBS5858488.1 type VI secretion system tip protein VgrG [Salmonella enterica subsp. enterica serovar Richmond]EBX1724689.1 type VI secretion system tip protein VgrG [Salmonella enterica subsp. enterica serovar Richm
MSFVSTNNKSGIGGLTTTTPPITGESGGVTADSVAGSVADAAEAAVEQAAGSLFGALPEPSGLVKAAVAAAQAAAAGMAQAAAAGMAQDAVSAIVSAVAGGPGAHNVTVSGSAVPPGALLFASLDGGETLSELFSYVVQLKTPDTLNLGYVSPAANLPLKPMVGKDLCVNIELDGGGKRHISGLVTAARVVGHEGRSVTYELRMEPWLKLLTHTSDYKAFQNKTVGDILDEVLAEYPYPVEKRLVESYPVRTWQVQYGETDFDFLQRLMQEWGIYWWFEHSEDSHTLVLADAISAHKACPDSPLVEWHQEGLKLDKEFIHTITANESLRTGQWVLDDFDFTKPRSLLANTVANPRETGHATYEHYEWPGDYFDKSEGEMLTRIRMEAQRSPGSRVLGGGNIRTLMTGYTFTLENYPTAEVNQEYLLMQTLLFVQDNAQHSGQDQHFTFSTRFELHPTREVFRPQRTVSKPHTKGPQSAIVTGPAGQEIWTDQYGRVKVQFGWDRYGKMDENSSCWIRVSYPWAGKGFGMIQIPRIGQEVLVDFKNGDPDLPIIVGRTYNQDTMPPWGLPGMASQSGIFSHSLYGGPTNGNMLRFDDKTGAEEVKFHAEKDLNTTVKNNETHTVMVDRTKTIIKNETNSIGEDRNTTVTKNDGLSVKLAQTINIGTTYRLDVGDQFTLRCGNAALVLHKDGSIEFCGKQLMLHTSDVMQLIGKGIDMNPDGGTAVTADDIAPLPTSE